MANLSDLLSLRTRRTVQETITTGWTWTSSSTTVLTVNSTGTPELRITRPTGEEAANLILNCNRSTFGNNQSNAIVFRNLGTDIADIQNRVNGDNEGRVLFNTNPGSGLEIGLSYGEGTSILYNGDFSTNTEIPYSTTGTGDLRTVFNAQSSFTAGQTASGDFFAVDDAGTTRKMSIEQHINWGLSRDDGWGNYSTYTPTWREGSTTFTPSTDNSYYYIIDNLCIAYIYMSRPADAFSGSGAISCTLPFNVNASPGGDTDQYATAFGPFGAETFIPSINPPVSIGTCNDGDNQVFIYRSDGSFFSYSGIPILGNLEISGMIAYETA